MSKTTDNPMIVTPAAPSAKSGLDSEPERRRAVRYPFTATAEVVELRSEARVTGRSSDLGLGGCFVDVLSPFPVGSLVRVRLERDRKAFEAAAKVSYAQQSLGMGLAFTEVKPEHRPVLRSWIAELSGEPLPEPVAAAPQLEMTEPEPEPVEVPPVLHLQQVLNELINLMVRKKVINEVEGTALLRKIFH